MATFEMAAKKVARFWHAKIWHAKITCQNFGSKIFSKSPQMATFEMAAKFWQADE